MPEGASVPLKTTSTAWLYQLPKSGARFGTPLTPVGAVASRLIVTDCELVPPALVAVQVRVVPAVSALIVVEPQPLLEEIADSLSVTDQETVTSLVYQPLLPCVPTTLGVITGGVLSVTTGATTCTVIVVGVPSFNFPPLTIGFVSSVVPAA